MNNFFNSVIQNSFKIKKKSKIIMFVHYIIIILVHYFEFLWHKNIFSLLRHYIPSPRVIWFCVHLQWYSELRGERTTMCTGNVVIIFIFITVISLLYQYVSFAPAELRRNLFAWTHVATRPEHDCAPRPDSILFDIFLAIKIVLRVLSSRS